MTECRARQRSVLNAPALQSFFTTYLAGQRGASAHTIAAYRNTWRLLLAYLAGHRHRRPAAADFTDLDSETVAGFLTHLETVRGNSTATRNARLAAIHAFFGYAAGIDTATISLWLGHESIESTQAYLRADLGIKQRALNRTAPPDTPPGRYIPEDALLKFLENL